MDNSLLIAADAMDLKSHIDKCAYELEGMLLRHKIRPLIGGVFETFWESNEVMIRISLRVSTKAGNEPWRIEHPTGFFEYLNFTYFAACVRKYYQDLAKSIIYYYNAIWC